MRLLAVLTLCLAACASPQKSPRIVVAIAGIEALDKEGKVLARAAEERLTEGIVNSRRFTVVERKRLGDVLEAQGADKAGHLVGADWVIYGSCNYWGVMVKDTGLLAEVRVQLRVVRTDDGQVLFSGGPPGFAPGPKDADEDALMFRAALESVDKLLGELERLPR